MKNYIMKILYILISLFILYCFFLCFFLLLFQIRGLRTCLEDFHLLYCLLFFYEYILLTLFWKILNYIMKNDVFIDFFNNRTQAVQMAFIY